MKKNMVKDIVSAGLIVVTLVLIAAGCRPFARMTAPDISAAVPSIAFEPIYLYYVAGGVLMVLGIVVVALRGRATGFILVAGGAGMACFGQTLLRHQWLSLVAVVGAGAVAGFIAYDRWKARRELHRNQDVGEILVQKIGSLPGGKEITASIVEDGPEKESLVRSVVGPIKERLAKRRQKETG